MPNNGVTEGMNNYIARVQLERCVSTYTLFCEDTVPAPYDMHK